MGKDDLFKKRKRAREKRKHDFRIPQSNSYLIVTEGTCTEPNYFNGLKNRIMQKVGGIVDVRKVPTIDINGEGMSTTRLIAETDLCVSRANILYQNVWVLFDKDDFPDFDRAIRIGKERGYHIAWSNQSFEYWIYLHFYYSDSDLSRGEWNKKLDGLFRNRGISPDGYNKNIEDLYDKLDSFGGVELAIVNAKRRMNFYQEKTTVPSQYAPGTMVYRLVEELREYLR